MKKGKIYENIVFSNEMVYSACNYFIKLCGVPIEKIDSILRITKDNLSIDYDNITEFFAKLFDADSFFVALITDGKELWIHGNKSGNSTIEVKLEKEVEIDVIINIFDDVKIKNDNGRIDDSSNSTTIDSEKVDRLEQTIDNHMKKSTKIAIIGIGITILGIVIGVITFSGYFPLQ